MKAKHSIKVNCPVCKEEAQVNLATKPSRFRSVITKLICAACDSRFLLTVARQKDLAEGQVSVACKLVGISEFGKELIRRQGRAQERINAKA